MFNLAATSTMVADQKQHCTCDVIIPKPVSLGLSGHEKFPKYARYEERDFPATRAAAATKAANASRCLQAGGGIESDRIAGT